MVSSLTGQSVNMAGTTRTSRLGDPTTVGPRASVDEPYPQNVALGSHLPTTGSGWAMGNIWSNGSIGSAVGSASRDRSRNREKNAFPSTGPEVIEGKTGSASLLQPETDPWTRRSPWTGTDANATRRSSGVSPARQRPSNSNSHNPPFFDMPQPTNHLSSNSRPSALGHDINRATSLQIDSISTSNMSTHPPEALHNGFGPYDRFHPRQHSDTAFNSWRDSASVHSPSEDRNSLSEYFGGGTSSAGASRNGSLPPSRHGEQGQYPPPPGVFAGFGQGQAGPGSRGHTSSRSSQSNHPFPERTNSFPNDPIAAFERLALQNSSTQQANGFHRPSASNVSAAAYLGQNQHDLRLLRHSFSGQAQTLDEGLLNAQNGYESFTPEGLPQVQAQEGSNQYSVSRTTEQGSLTPGSSDHRPSPFYSTGGTPPVFDHLYPSRNDQQRVPSHYSTAYLERRLRGLQQEQQTYVNPPYNQMFQLPQQYRSQLNPYQYQVPSAMANGMPLNGVPPSLQVPAGPGFMPMEPPRAPKDHDVGQGLRSALLEEFKSNNKGGRRYELKDLYDHVVEFSGDQHGSRFIQQKLETANSDEKDRVFKEIQSNAMQLMQDVFGNYVIQKFFEHGDQSQKKVLANKMKGHVLDLSLQMYGCRVVQKALEHVLTDQQAILVKELEHSVLRCVKDQNGNHVIQKAIERVPAEHIQFIINAFTGQVASLATHPYGCRVIQRMLEHCEDPARNLILQELHACGTNLISDQYGNYVTQHIIEHGRPQDRAMVIGIVRTNLLNFSKHKFASNVVEKCLVFGSDGQRREIMLKVIEKPEQSSDPRDSRQKETNLSALIKDNYGNYVIQKLLDVLNPADYPLLHEALGPELFKAKRQIAGKQVLAVEKKMHRFDKKFDSPLDVPSRLAASTSSAATSPGTPNMDISATATPPPPLTADAQSLRSDSIPSTTMSAVDEPVTGMMMGLSKVTTIVVPQIGVTDTSE